MNRKLLGLVPFLIFIFLCVFLYQGLFGNPREIQTGRLGHTMPEFSLPDLMDSDKTWTADSLKGEVYLMNVWGTWCPTCIAELGYLTELRERGVKIIGLYYEQAYDPDFGDQFDINALRQDVNNMLSRAGNPYQFNILDLERTLALDLGVSGAPETFLVDKQGKILLHHTGDINERVWRTKFAAIYQELTQ
ncbi:MULTISPECIES: redoxin family protein [Pseudoalteromonas]|uniref:Thiol:disulfide interchange protein n=1 Tax=Pseudoalteromonas piscicida TaxID=43662 RepID=A0AAD0W3S3_PSEO7|nr:MULTISPECIES: redoxin family protein [Pseudoalteromonas]ASD67433.1 thiol:disulfide interchange protein [Pseudoalteromonas piscicida]AXR01866.1 thiol:disulfide interchange protein [Pseudoalteromonas piscicida]KJY92840.1 thiol:disulfide interchange protein DsbE [Pseudoalteromonas piscicida]MDP4488508.1 redoxin family protein [Pseudoalteromonas piscicida]TMN35510.1 thiol:disulfide interchange protein [Pseudoalteromonas piscicida]